MAESEEQQALRRFRECYPDLTSDERLMRMVNEEVIRLSAEQDLVYAEALFAAAKSVRDTVTRWARAIRRAREMRKRDAARSK